jgi:diacylglycerol O-acyltransferase / wax synthase
MELLRPQDAFFLHVETPRVQQHVCGLALIDPALPGGGRLTLDDLVRTVESRLDRLPRFRQRLAVPPLSLARPAWVDAEAFDVRFHVRAVTAQAPGGLREVEDAVGALMSRPIDRSRPLWEMYLIEGLQDGRIGYLIKLHHAIADGLGGIAVVRTVFDTRPEGPVFPPSRWVPTSPPTGLSLFAGTLKEQAIAPFRLMWDALCEAALAPGPALGRAARTAAGLWELARAGTAPPSPLNHPVAPERRFAGMAVDLAQAKRIWVAFGGTLNDLVLATMAGALQRFFQEREDARPQRPLRAMVPVSLRTKGRRGSPGNWTTAYSFALPVHAGPAGPRMTAVVAVNKGRDRSRELGAARFVMNVAGTWLPQPLHAVVSRLMYRGKWFNLIVSTMPGTSQTRYLAGARLEVAYPVLPLAEGVGLTVGAMTWEGRLTFGMTADAGIIPDVDRLAAAVTESFEELVDAAETAGPRPDAGELQSPAGEASAVPSI